jgi:hypothetical protein
VTSKLVSLEYERTYGDLLPEISLKFIRTINSLVTMSTGLVVEVWRGWTVATEEKIFSGYIEKFEPQGGLIIVTGIDKLWDLVRGEVTHVYDTTVGINTTATAFKLIDSTARFILKEIRPGNYVRNTTDATTALVVSVDSETQLTLDTNIFLATSKAYAISIGSTAGKISEIFKDIVNNYTSLVCDDTTVQDSGGEFVLEKFICNHTDPFERCKALADVLDWQFYYRADTDKVYFEPKGYTTNVNTLTVGSNVMQVPKWQYDITEMANDITFMGAMQVVETTKSGRIGTTAGFNTTGIALDYEPISVKVYGDASNPPTTLKKGGTPGAFATFDYFVDKTNRMIYPRATTTFTNNDYYEIRYSLAAPIPINMYDQGSIDTYGRFVKSITLKDVRSVVDAEQRGTNYLNTHSIPFIYTTLKVKNTSTMALKVGEMIAVVDNVSVPAVSATLLINKLRIRWPADYDEIDVGDKYWRLAEFQTDVMEKLKRLEEDELSNSDIVNNLVNIDNTAAPITVKNRYSQIITQTVSGTNVWIWGNSSYGIWGTNAWGSTGIGAETTSVIIQGLNAYTENFYDNDFKAGTTTATWNTSTNQLTFTSGQTARSTAVDYNNGTITTVTMTVTKSSGTFTYYVSANGGTNWVAATSGVPQSVGAYTGTDLRWRIDETGASTGTVTKVELTAYH